LAATNEVNRLAVLPEVSRCNVHLSPDFSSRTGSHPPLWVPVGRRSEPPRQGRSGTTVGTGDFSIPWTKRQAEPELCPKPRARTWIPGVQVPGTGPLVL